MTLSFGEAYHKVYVAFSNGASFDSPSETGILTSIPKYDFSKSRESQETRGKQWLVDINQDGRIDFVQKMEAPNQGGSEDQRMWELSIHLYGETGFTQKVIALSHKSTGKVDGEWNHADEFTQITDMDSSDGMLNYVNIEKDTNTIIVYKIDLDKVGIAGENALIKHTTFDIGGKSGTKSKEEREHNMWLTDVNGDGKQDLVVLNGTNQLITYLYTGKEFITPGITSNLTSDVHHTNNKTDASDEDKIKNTYSGKMFSDINGDGKRDFVWYNNGEVHVACSNGHRFENVCDFSIPGNPLIAAIDIDGNARVDIIQAPIKVDINGDYIQIAASSTSTSGGTSTSDSNEITAYTFKQKYHGKLRSISGEYKKQYEFSYKLAPLPTAGATRIYPILPYPYPNLVVNKWVLKHNSNEVGSNSFTYSESKIYHSSKREEKKVLGFSTLTKNVTMGSKHSKEVKTFSQDYDLAGSITSQKNYIADDKIVYQKDTNYEKVTHNNSDWVRETSIKEYHYTEDTTTPLYTKSVSITYNGGNIQKKEISTTQKSQAGVTPESFVESIEMTNYNTYGIPKKITKKSGTEVFEQAEYDIDSQNNITQKRILISNSEGYSTTDYLNDSYGNVHIKTDPNGNKTTFTYDPDVHTFPTIVKKTYNGKEYSTIKEYDTLNGNVKSITNSSKVTAYIDYDSYGRKTKVWYPGNPKNINNFNEEFIYVDTDSEHSITKIVKDDSSSGIWQKAYKDDWNRVYKTESKIRNGTFSDEVLTVETQYYDNRELVKQKSLPYVNESDKKWIEFIYDYLDRPIEVRYPDGKSKIEKGITTTYTYYPSGKTEKVTTSAGDETSVVYDMLGRERSITTPNSGTTSSTYYSNGLLKTNTDARGKIITYKYDSLDRLEEIQRADGENPIIYEYYEDGIGSLGQLKRIQDDSGTTEFFYNTKGQLNAKMVKIDDFSFIFRYAYDDIGRLNNVTYPNGVAINQIYSESGHLHEITMDSADGTNVGNRVVSYGINSTDHQLERLTGNNVKTTISYDINTKKPTRLKTKLSNGDIVQNWKYVYKSNGLLESIEDYTYGSDMWSGKYTQIFGYDDKDRLNSAEGYFGPNRERQTLSYNYDEKGNMDTKGDMTLTYTHSNHPHAVSSATSPSIGTINYDYDSAGNMIRRENDDFHYNSLGKLIQINKQSGEVVDYEYNYTGNRIKKSITNGASIATTYNIDGLYEVNVIPGKAVRHTLYVRGPEGDLVAQLTTENVELLTTVAEAPTTFDLDRFVTYLQMEASKFFYYTNLENPYNLKLYAFYALLIFGLLYVFSLKLVEISHQENLSTRKFSAFTMLISQLTIIAVLFSCMPKALTGSSENEDPPFWLVTSFVNGGGGIDAETPAITDSPGSLSPAYNSGLPTTGMFFIHPDHLGSTSMLTNAKGEMVAGVDINSGKSYVTYKPYGEVNKTNSSGPDIFRYKYTAQEFDSETGLHYYKARYYDPVTGHFTQADSYLDSEFIMGFNQYMYTFGNPVNHTDPGGHFFASPVFEEIIDVLTQPFDLEKLWEDIEGWIEDFKDNFSANLMTLVTVALVVTVAFAATIAIGAFVAWTASAAVTAMGFSGITGGIMFHIGTVLAYTIEGILGYYAGELVTLLGREIGRTVGSLFAPKFGDMSSEEAQGNAELGEGMADFVGNVTDIAIDIPIGEGGVANPFYDLNNQWGNINDGYLDRKFNFVDKFGNQGSPFLDKLIRFKPSDAGYHVFSKHIIGLYFDKEVYEPYYYNHNFWGERRDPYPYSP